jgi:uncharacterized metal-binding protein
MTKGGLPGRACPSHGREGAVARANAAYAQPATREFARQASIQEASCYAGRGAPDYVMQPTKPRLVEICQFARRLEVDTVGLAFCIGLAGEAAAAARVMEAWGLAVASICCKAGRTGKRELLGLGPEHFIHAGPEEAMCNPVYQAQALEEAGAGLLVLLGLCVGHDSLFIRHAARPVTVLAVKDRVAGHNPLGPLYTSGTYYRRLLHPELWDD